MLKVGKLLQPVIMEGATDTEATLKFAPLDRGFGITIGNALRRVLLGSLEGAAAVGIKIEGVTNEFSTIVGVKEDVCDIVLNIKGIYFKVDSYQSDFKEEVKLAVSQPGVVTAGDLKLPYSVSVLNPNHVICTLAEGGKIEMTITVGVGRGYEPASEHKNFSDDIDFIPVDSIFTPVLAASYEVSPYRVGQDLNYDELRLTVKTNGTYKPTDVIAISAKFLTEQLSKLHELKADVDMTVQTEVMEEEVEKKEEISIDDLQLSQRAQNCLMRAKIYTLQDLVSKTEDEMKNIRNLGAKSFDEINNKLKEMGKSFKGSKEKEN